jgi:hypothetical protein
MAGGVQAAPAEVSPGGAAMPAESNSITPAIADERKVETVIIIIAKLGNSGPSPLVILSRRSRSGGGQERALEAIEVLVQTMKTKLYELSWALLAAGLLKRPCGALTRQRQKTFELRAG